MYPLNKNYVVSVLVFFGCYNAKLPLAGFEPASSPSRGNVLSKLDYGSISKDIL